MQIIKLDIKICELIAKVEAASDHFIEFLLRLNMLILYAARLIEMSSSFLETGPAQEKLPSIDTIKKRTCRPLKISSSFLETAPDQEKLPSVASTAKKVVLNQ